MSVKDNAATESKVVKWLECHFRIAGIRPFSAKMTPNKRKEKPNQPDYIIYLRVNINKGDSFRDIAIGSLWLGEKVIDGVNRKFMTGSLEVAFKKINIAVWKAEPRFDGEVINYLYDIKTMEDTTDYGTYQPPMDNDMPPIDEDEIPF